MNRSECYPVLVSLTSEEPAVPSRQTLSGIAGADRYVTLYTEGPVQPGDGQRHMDHGSDRGECHRHRTWRHTWPGQHRDAVKPGCRRLGHVLGRDPIQRDQLPIGVLLKLGGHVSTLLEGGTQENHG